MTVLEYREKHKKCNFCRYVSEWMVIHYCYAKKIPVINSRAKKCPLYDAKYRK